MRRLLTAAVSSRFLASLAAALALAVLAASAAEGAGGAGAATAAVLRFYSAAAPGPGADVEANPAAAGGSAPALYAYVERSISTYGPMASAGQDTWVTLAYYFPSASYRPSRGWFGLWGVKGWGGASFNSVAPWGIDGSDGRLKVEQNSGAPYDHWDTAANRYVHGSLPEWGPTYNHEYDLGPIPLGRWTTLVLHFHWAHDQSGLVQVWRDARLLVSRHTPTLAADDDRMRWPHQSAYRPGPPTNDAAVVFYQAPMHVGSTLAEALGAPPALPSLSQQVDDGNSTITAVSAAAVGIPPAPMTASALVGGPAAPAKTSGIRPSVRRKTGSAKRHASARIETSSGCRTCRVHIGPSGITASIRGGHDANDTAIWLRPVRARLPVTVTDRLRLGSARPLDANLAVLQLRDRTGQVLWEIYVASDRSLHLWSPAGALGQAATNRPLRAAVPSFDATPLPLSVTLTPRRSLVVRVQGRVALALRGLAAPSATAASVRFGIDHYDGSSGNAITVAHTAPHVD